MDVDSQYSHTSLLNASSSPRTGEDTMAHVECMLKTTSTLRYQDAKAYVCDFLRQKVQVLDNSAITYFGQDKFMEEHVEMLRVSSSDDGCDFVDVQTAELLPHIFQLQEESAVEETQPGEDVPSFNQWLLPSSQLDGLWDSLIFDSGIKTKLLEYINTTFLFSDRMVNDNLITWNRVVLLHGPPGTGKTSLCKALAHKLSIRLSERFMRGYLIEINSHSLFSKWFSESGKLVLKMFQMIRELTSDEEAFVCILIDEVESLTVSRQTSVGAEPSDAVRVVNALLTQLDQIKREKNVLILTTSNLSDAIDPAFLDRADIKQYIGVPNQAAIYNILQSSINELVRVEIIATQHTLLDWREVQLMQMVENDTTTLSLSLFRACKDCEGMSGRSLRKLPFLAHAYYLQRAKVSLEEFLAALIKAIAAERESTRQLTAGKGGERERGRK